MSHKKKTWREKLHDSKDLPKIVHLNERQREKWIEAETMVVPAPLEVDEIMRLVPEGKIITVNRIREKLAQKHNADVGCPMTTGIFSWIAAHASAEDEKDGKQNFTPWWRTIKSEGELNPKFPGGVEEQAKRLIKEGMIVIPGRKKGIAMVKDFKKYSI